MHTCGHSGCSDAMGLEANHILERAFGLAAPHVLFKADCLREATLSADRATGSRSAASGLSPGCSAVAICNAVIAPRRAHAVHHRVVQGERDPACSDLVTSWAALGIACLESAVKCKGFATQSGRVGPQFAPAAASMVLIIFCGGADQDELA